MVVVRRERLIGTRAARDDADDWAGKEAMAASYTDWLIANKGWFSNMPIG